MEEARRDAIVRIFGKPFLFSQLIVVILTILVCYSQLQGNRNVHTIQQGSFGAAIRRSVAILA
jgi:hypothetical protein